MRLRSRMGMQTRQIVAGFGPDYARLAGQVRYTVFDYSGVAVLGPTGAGVAELIAAPGTYLATPSLDTAWAGRIEWAIAGVAGVAAVDDFGRVLGGYRVAVCSFGADNAGLAGQVGLAVLDTAGSVLATGVRGSAAQPR